jgi:hypothetical protein
MPYNCRHLQCCFCVSYNDTTLFVLFTNVWVGILVPLVEIADIPAGWAVQLKATQTGAVQCYQGQKSPEQIVWLDGEKSDYR